MDIYINEKFFQDLQAVVRPTEEKNYVYGRSVIRGVALNYVK